MIVCKRTWLELKRNNLNEIAIKTADSYDSEINSKQNVTISEKPLDFIVYLAFLNEKFLYLFYI